MAHGFARRKLEAANFPSELGKGKVGKGRHGP